MTLILQEVEKNGLTEKKDEYSLVESGARGPRGTDGTDGTDGTNGTNGTDGTDGVGVPAGGTAGQQLAKIDGDDYNTEWVDPGGGGAEWTPVGSVQEITTTGINEILFSGLDFEVYEYRVYGRIAYTGAESTGLRWYSFETDAASVVQGDYEANRFYGFNSVLDTQADGNFICKTFGDSTDLTVFNAFFSKSLDGVLVGFCSDSVNYTSGLINFGFFTSSAAFGHTTGATKVGLYAPTRDFAVGSKMQLFRKAVL